MATNGDTKTKTNEEIGLEVIKKIMDKPKNKTKDELISDLIDLHQLYDKDVISYSKKINDLTGDLQIKNEVIKDYNENETEMQAEHDTEIDGYESDLEAADEMIVTLETVIEGKDELIKELRSIITELIEA